jgi:AGZA family xanthine/uracil permease-like MFS transporter
VSNAIRHYFGLERAGTTWTREIVADATAFVTMSYIVVVNPAILKAAGIPAEASMVATTMTAVFGTLLMGLYANRPFAIAPYMGENAVCGLYRGAGLGLSLANGTGGRRGAADAVSHHQDSV